MADKLTYAYNLSRRGLGSVARHHFEVCLSNFRQVYRDINRCSVLIFCDEKTIFSHTPGEHLEENAIIAAFSQLTSTSTAMNQFLCMAMHQGGCLHMGRTMLNMLFIARDLKISEKEPKITIRKEGEELHLVETFDVYGFKCLVGDEREIEDESITLASVTFRSVIKPVKGGVKYKTNGMEINYADDFSQQMGILMPGLAQRIMARIDPRNNYDMKIFISDEQLGLRKPARSSSWPSRGFIRR